MRADELPVATFSTGKRNGERLKWQGRFDQKRHSFQLEGVTAFYSSWDTVQGTTFTPEPKG